MENLIFFIEIACPPGRFGKNCEALCECGLNHLCDYRTGACLCKSGFQGANCDEGKRWLYELRRKIVLLQEGRLSSSKIEG